MKTLGKIKLNQFSRGELDRRKMNALKGGCNCSPIYGTNCKCNCSGGGDFERSESDNANYYGSQSNYVYSY